MSAPREWKPSLIYSERPKDCALNKWWVQIFIWMNNRGHGGRTSGQPHWIWEWVWPSWLVLGARETRPGWVVGTVRGQACGPTWVRRLSHAEFHKALDSPVGRTPSVLTRESTLGLGHLVPCFSEPQKIGRKNSLGGNTTFIHSLMVWEILTRNKTSWSSQNQTTPAFSVGAKKAMQVLGAPVERTPPALEYES